MEIYRIRKIVFFAIIGVSLVSIIAIWTNRLSLYNPIEYPYSRLDTVLATVIQNTGTVGGIALALVFITAQLSASKTSVLRELYKSTETYILLLFFVATILLGYAALVAVPDGTITIRLTNTVLVLACAFVLLIVPVLMLQVENLNLTTLASKLSNKINPRTVIDYGLTSVQAAPGDPTRIEYQLITVGLRPLGIDPFRPIHEILMEAVNARDRVLFGKLFRYLLKQIAVVHGAKWDLTSRIGGDFISTDPMLSFLAKRYSREERIHLTLAILHYSVKRARNLLTEWNDRDIGRHGILTGIGDLIRCLSYVPQANISIRISIYAALHIAEYYKGVRPFGRIEPFNSYFEAANRLESAGKVREAELCAAVLGWVSIHTEQLRSDRSPNLQNGLSSNLQSVFWATQTQAKQDPGWLPGLESEDPWRKWLE